MAFLSTVRGWRWWRLILCAGLAFPYGRTGAQAGILSPVTTVAMSATKVSSLSVSVLSGAAQTLATIADGTANDFPTPVRIRTSWALPPGVGSVRMMAYFTTPAQALQNGAAFLSSARMRGRVLTTPVLPWQPTTWRAFTQNGSAGAGVNGGTLRLFRMRVTSANRTSSRTTDLDLRLDLTGQPPINAGTWTGTINLRAVAI